ncbi:DUF5690 family protein [Tuwongella immobilis]|uniref:DUF5690 family protein n=1 Tax=Tuwongella immobilis TaxID=692036 RepID=UPI0018D89610|nr:DUF5690 family protein [Tuwongella immobilis]
MSERETVAATHRQSIWGVPLALWSVVAAFGTYFCMYGFRKPFTVSDYAGQPILWGLGFKDVLVMAQVLGYMLSKFMGIKVVSEMPPRKRALALLGMILAAHATLLGFALTPAPWNCLWLFGNGICLGMVFGMVLGFLEGRKNTELLTAGLCVSFIVADGVMKSVGDFLLQKQGVSLYWMPVAAGGVFVLPLIGFVWMLSKIPAPSAADVAARSERVPMNKSTRGEFFRRYAVGLVLLAGAYLLITVLRSVRADFSKEIWNQLDPAYNAAIFTQTELLVGLAILLLLGSTILIRDNRRAFDVAMALGILGGGFIVLALVGLSSGVLSPFWFMALLGLGTYLPYIAVHTTIFERLIAMTRDRGNIGYLMYFVDAFGYLGYVAVLVVKNLMKSQGTQVTGNFLDFFVPLSWGVAILCVVMLIPCWLYFVRHPSTQGTPSKDVA